ncbi:hypothetical protein SCOR_10300 [Sulfidibacter corallicola]|uniref:Uncharacterized protein n=1 Tax=Sulfidibacter corallicola TaxID=2818388 RepID=A0A8A4TDU6_SULCO|nr:hypothetical protein [Sulfidibacter corallicola]QTD48269.1 hypothetical protein J3U87_22015 [Sulfidibacter corallicola]
MTTIEDLLKSVESQIANRDAQAAAQGARDQAFSQYDLDRAEEEAHLVMDEHLALAIVADLRQCIGADEGWSLVLAGSRALRVALEEDDGLLRKLQQEHREILDELAGDLIRLGFKQPEFEIAIRSELETLCTLFKKPR